MASRKRFRFTTLRDVVKPAQQYDRTIEKTVIEIAKKVVARGGGQSYVTTYAVSLQSIERRYGASVMCRVVQFQQKYGLYVVESYYLNCVAEFLAASKEDLLHRTVVFLVRHGMYATKLVEVVRGIERWGEQELRDGMALAPRPSRTAPDSRYPWNRARVWQQEKERYCGFVVELGLSRLVRLVTLLRSHNLDSDGELHVLYRCAHYGNDKDAAIRELESVIALVRQHNLSVASYLVAAYLAVNERHGTMAEVAEILALAAQYGVESISAENFNFALEWWRQPGKRYIVTEAFQAKTPGMLSTVQFALTFAGFFQMGFDGSPEPLGKRMARDYRTEARARTKEILAPRLVRYGLFGPMQDMVEIFAPNPLLPDSVLRLDYEAYNVPSNLTEEAERRYGRDTIIDLCRRMPDVDPTEVGLALRRSSPTHLRRVLDTVERYEVSTVLRAIGWYGWKETCQALKIVRECKLEVATLFCIIRQLRVRSKRLVFTQQHVNHLGEIEVITPAHHASYQSFCQLPTAEKRALARAIRLYRRVYHIIFWRIITRRV